MTTRRPADEASTTQKTGHPQRYLLGLEASQPEVVVQLRAGHAHLQQPPVADKEATVCKGCSRQRASALHANRRLPALPEEHQRQLGLVGVKLVCGKRRNGLHIGAGAEDGRVRPGRVAVPACRSLGSQRRRPPHLSCCSRRSYSATAAVMSPTASCTLAAPASSTVSSGKACSPWR